MHELMTSIGYDVQECTNYTRKFRFDSIENMIGKFPFITITRRRTCVPDRINFYVIRNIFYNQFQMLPWLQIHLYTEFLMICKQTTKKISENAFFQLCTMPHREIHQMLLK